LQSFNLSNLEIDDLLYTFLDESRGERLDAGAVEAAAMVLNYCIKNLPGATSRKYLEIYLPRVLKALSPEIIDTFGYDTLKMMPSILHETLKLPQHLKETVRNAMNYVEFLLAYHEFILTGSCPLKFKDRVLKLLEKKRSASGAQVANIAFVSVNPQYPELFTSGKLISVSVELKVTGELNLFRSVQPVVALKGKVIEEEDPFIQQLRRSVDFAEGFFFGMKGTGEIVRMPREYHFGLADDGDLSRLVRLFTGGSAGLGFALLAMSAIDRMNLRRNQKLIRGDVAFTGSIDADGKVEPVTREGIDKKVQAVFHSHCRSFVLPTGNLERADQELQRLEKIYPARKLELIPVQNVLDAYEDERVMQTIEVPGTIVLSSRLKRSRKTLIAGIATIAALLALIVLLPPRLAHRLATYDFDGQSILMRNEYGRVFKTYPLPYRVLEQRKNPKRYESRSYQFFFDNALPLKGKELVLISVEVDSLEKTPAGRIHLHCFADNGRLVRHVALWDSLEVRTSDGKYSFKRFYYVQGELNDLDGDGYKEAVLSFTDRLYFPSGVVVISLRDGSTRSFVHLGHMKKFVIGDFDRNGKKEIVVGGERNGTNTCFIVVLDPDVMDGSTPSFRTVKFTGFEDDVAKYYIKIPISSLCLQYRKVCGHEGCAKPSMVSVQLDEERRPQFGVTENFSNREKNSILYTLGRDWRCVSITFTDFYLASFQSAFGINDDAALRDSIEANHKRLMSGFKYLDKNKWVDELTVNSGYLETLKKRKLRNKEI